MQAIYETVNGIINSGRVGVPVFARFLVKAPPGMGKSEEILAGIINIECLWLDLSPQRIYVQHGRDLGHISATVQYQDGKTAIAGVGVVPDADVTFDLMLLGNKGGIYHESDMLSMESHIDAKTATIPESLKVAIEHSLEMGKPVTL